MLCLASRTCFLLFGILSISGSSADIELAEYLDNFHGHDGDADTDEYTNEWVVHLDNADEEVAELLALKMSYQCLGEIPGFPGYYLMQKNDHPVVSSRDGLHHTRSLREDARVLWAQQLFRKSRVKRDFFTDDDENRNLEYSIPNRHLPDPDRSRTISNQIPLDLADRWSRKIVPRRPISTRGESDDLRGIPADLLALWDAEEKRNGKYNVEPANTNDNMFNDLQWKDQWYMNNRHTRSIDEPEVDLHVVQVYKEFGLSGKGIRVVVLDDGLEYTHPDISNNYDPSISFDYNNGTSGDRDPFPDKRKSFPNSHGTRCAGEIAMVANNRICGVGVAYEASIGAIRMLDGVINDRVEGLSLQHAIDKVDIFSASWGPNDDGKTVEGPGRMALTALVNGVTKGRNGKGVIYVWASGNGGMNNDNCNCDGYTSSMYTISIGSTSQRGRFPWYGERCASTMATTFSSGESDEKKVATIDTNSECTEGHTGTSAAAPLAAGIIALVLQHNPELTWRDVQHLVVWSSTIDSVMHNPGWYTNGIGLPYNHRFGFGVMDAYRMVSMASDWKNVDVQNTCIVEPSSITNPTIANKRPSIITFSTDGCKDFKDKAVNYIEHVEVLVNLNHTSRGNLEIVLESKSGTMSQLLTRRPKDRSKEGLTNWRFNTVHFWGEPPEGNWHLIIIDRPNARQSTINVPPEGNLGEIKLLLHGTATMPEIQRKALNDKTLDVTEGVQNNLDSETSPEKRFERFLEVENPLMTSLNGKEQRDLTWSDVIGEDVNLS